MIVVKSLADTSQISNTAIRELVRKRINDLGGDAFDATELGFFLVVESGDTLEAINDQLGFDILCNRWTGVRYDQADFSPSFEFVEEFPWCYCYDMVFILSDDGFGVEVFVSVEEGIDPELLAMCQRYAVRGTP
jgi:hypothetical protein